MFRRNKEKKPPGRFRRSASWAFKSFLNVKAWVGFDEIKQTFGTITGSLKHLFIPQQAKFHETFEEAKARLGLSEADLKQKEQDFLRLAIILFLISLTILFYAAYFAWNGFFAAFTLTFSVCLIALGHAFRYHFWFFQVRSRKLGCSIRDWYESSFKGESS